MNWASVIMKARERFWAAVATSAARQEATCGYRVKFGHEGAISNILGDPSAIQIGADSFLRGHLQVFGHGGKIRIGEWFYMGPHSTVWSSGAGISIGNRVLISWGVHIHDTNSHPMDSVKRFDQTKAILTRGHPRNDPGIATAPVTIGDDVWLTSGVTIMKGVTIGPRTVIGTGAIVRADVPADAFVKPWGCLGLVSSAGRSSRTCDPCIRVTCISRLV